MAMDCLFDVNEKINELKKRISLAGNHISYY